jgi:HNH endonuclease
MNLKNLKDADLLASIQTHVKSERQILTAILHHLREIEVRKLFSELGYPSLFDYAVFELKYSRGEAGRKIQAMRLLKELPQIEEKIESGALNLTHICQVQSLCANKRKLEDQIISNTEKLQIFQKIENTSTRESEKILLSLSPIQPLPKERERLVTPQATEMRFVIDEKLKSSLDEVRSLLGIKNIHMNFADLVQEMAHLSVASLKAKRFGQKRAVGIFEYRTKNTKATTAPIDSQKTVARKTQYLVWQRDQGKCTKCGGGHNLNIDHIHPRALGGNNAPENLRLLCFHCNQR